MHRLLLVAFLLPLVGCRHASGAAPRPLPTLPASHGQLSRALHEYLGLSSIPSVSGDSFENSETVVELDQAPAVFAEAQRILDGQPTQQEVRQAAEDLGAACTVGFSPACDFLRQHFTRPVRLEGEMPAYPSAAAGTRWVGMAVVHCRLGVEGTMHDCEVVERAPYGYTEALLEAIRHLRYRPVALAGHPIEVPYNLRIQLAPRNMALTRQQELPWIRARTKNFPRSVSAWGDLAERLAEYAPEEPEYLAALERLHALAPAFWWSANELAWEHARAGRFAEAEPFARRARERAPLNAYVLETSAITWAGLGQCEQAVAARGAALEWLPAEWPAAERERFQRDLDASTRRCAAK